ncbi:8-oxo-dGTP diphosphatase [Saccharicrinis carchari]|uniref:8-oxo-dGTP diphosphatase n=1 Tax=Saccharicrinis carchari TaxID=1168039 RepID=A0A521E3X6_SACCC|nr:NUDIX hydrolase [Saccharicrinis carchari]SMO78654.1 8-oxo-dGTP diphosphatase [Saccharicrinis carchari]
MSFSYQYPRPAVTVDIVLVTTDDPAKILLIQRKHPPFEGEWALPGGFLDMDEDLHTAALRELQEETGIENLALNQFKTFGAVDRDPRGRTISVVFYAFIPRCKETLAGDDASKAEWFELSKLPQLAFDHNNILNEFKSQVMAL